LGQLSASGSGLISPHGGTLVNLLVDDDRAEQLRSESRHWISWSLTPRQLCDLELLATGGFSPLNGFMTRADYEPVCRAMRLADGTLWPMPITLDVPEAFARTVLDASTIALRDPEGVMIAALHVADVWRADRRAEAADVFGTTDPVHPGVAAILRNEALWIVGGRLEVVRLPLHYDFQALRLTPAEVRAVFSRHGCTRVVAFQTRNVMHRAHRELTLRAAESIDAHLLIHPVVGLTKPGDTDHYTRVRCYRRLLATYPDGSATLSLLPLAMRMAGPREAVWHALIRKNFGCTHFIVGRDHAGPGQDSAGRPFYGAYAAQELLRAHEREIGVAIVPFRQMVYLPSEDRYAEEGDVPASSAALRLSGTELRRLLTEGRSVPEWFTYPVVAEELRRTHPPRGRQGLTIFFTGLSGAGKSTIANILRVKLLELGQRPVTLLDGDVVRRHLSSELGFSKEHRDINVRRIGYVASEITKNGGIALCAPIAPYDSVRREVREMIEPVGGFVLVYVATPIETCERRDRKGLYAKARAGLVEQFTGVTDPYEVPTDAAITLDATVTSPDEAANSILNFLARDGFIEIDSLALESWEPSHALERSAHRWESAI
jgi:sulfate adenylyltransferase